MLINHLQELLSKTGSQVHQETQPEQQNLENGDKGANAVGEETEISKESKGVNSHDADDGNVGKKSEDQQEITSEKGEAEAKNLSETSIEDETEAQRDSKVIDKQESVPEVESGANVKLEGDTIIDKEAKNNEETETEKGLKTSAIAKGENGAELNEKEENELKPETEDHQKSETDTEYTEDTEKKKLSPTKKEIYEMEPDIIQDVHPHDVEMLSLEFKTPLSQNRLQEIDPRLPIDQFVYVTEKLLGDDPHP